MSLLSDDPFVLVQAARAAAALPTATADDFTAPAGEADVAVELVAPGVMHPMHAPWIAAAIGMTEDEVRAAIDVPGDSAAFASIADRLAHAAAPPALAALGVAPHELLLRRLPARLVVNRVPRAGGHPVLATENAHWRDLARNSATLAELRQLDVPPILFESRSLELQHGFLRLLAVFRGRTRYAPAGEQYIGDIILPQGRADTASAPLRPLEVRLSNDVVILRFEAALVAINLDTGGLTSTPFASGTFARIDDAEAVFCNGAQLTVFDLAGCGFVQFPRSLPDRLALGACCGIEVLATASRKTAIIPGVLASSAFDFVTSPCGDYLWLDVQPAADDLGVVGLGQLASAYRVWPHAVLGTPVPADGESGEGHDRTVRAVAAHGLGFRLLYGAHILDGDHAHALPATPLAASFDRSGKRLITADTDHLAIYDLDATGRPSLASWWSLAPLAAHLTLDALDLTGLVADPEALLGAVGTVGGLAASSVDDLRDRLFSDERDDVLQRLIDQARALEPTTRVTRS